MLHHRCHVPGRSIDCIMKKTLFKTSKRNHLHIFKQFSLEMFGEIRSEMPPYDLIERKQGYEIRQYHRQFWAQSTYEVPLNTDFSMGGEQGFFPLFNYISGKNQSQMKIAMTSPVVMQEMKTNQSVRRTMNFILSPSTFHSSNQIPKTNDRNVELIERSQFPPMACITFNMIMTTERNAIKEQELRQVAERDGLILSPHRTDVMYFGYNAPNTLPQYRRNEICIPIVGQN